jgi:hypothetical protein
MDSSNSRPQSGQVTISPLTTSAGIVISPSHSGHLHFIPFLAHNLYDSSLNSECVVEGKLKRFSFARFLVE